MYLANPNMTSYIMVHGYSGTHSRIYLDTNQHVFWLFRLEQFHLNLLMANMRLTRGLAYLNRLFLEDLDLIILEIFKHVFKAWLPFFGKLCFYASHYDGPATHTRSKVRITSNPPTPPPRVSQEGLPDAPRGRSNTGQKPIGKAYLVKDGSPIPETTSYLRSITIPDAFKKPEPAITIPKVVDPTISTVRSTEYQEQLRNTIVAPSQGEIEEQQEFLATIYKVIEDKLAEEEGIYLASDAEVSDIKWQPLAPDADLPSADIISKEWAQAHTHSEFLRDQAHLNNIVAATWRFWWSANPPNKTEYPDLYSQWSKIEDYCRVTTQTWYNI
ncbi:hypothetical protein AX15_006971 [Amanita polypyramis BW_CC]|nr:hypothetical protein AX15_006971 [Amanita polypyramis BW_CC]